MNENHCQRAIRVLYIDSLSFSQPIFLSAQVICPQMIKQGYGGFINLTSTGCTRPRAGFAFYNASKAAVNVKILYVTR